MIIEAWKQVGIDTVIANLSSSAANEPGNRGRRLGVARAGGNVSVAERPERWHSTSIPIEQSGWRGDNVSRYSRPEVDGAYIPEQGGVLFSAAARVRGRREPIDKSRAGGP